MERGSCSKAGRNSRCHKEQGPDIRSGARSAGHRRRRGKNWYDRHANKRSNNADLQSDNLRIGFKRRLCGKSLDRISRRSGQSAVVNAALQAAGVEENEIRDLNAALESDRQAGATTGGRLGRHVSNWLGEM